MDMKSRLKTLLILAVPVLILGALILPALQRPTEGRRYSCQNNLKQWGLVFKMYTNENEHHAFPPMLEVDGVWVPDLKVLYAEYMCEPTMLLCPQNPLNPDCDPRQFNAALQRTPPDWDAAQHITAQNYCCVGWAVHSKEDIDLLLNTPHRKSGEDIKTGDRTLYWLRDGIERFYIQDINDPAASARVQCGIPVAFDNPATHSHKPGGVNVLFLDGHVEFVKLPKDASFRQVLETIIQARRRG